MGTDYKHFFYKIQKLNWMKVYGLKIFFEFYFIYFSYIININIFCVFSGDKCFCYNLLKAILHIIFKIRITKLTILSYKTIYY